MTREKFDQLIERLQQESAADPPGFAAKVVAIALGGFAYLILVLALALSLTIGTVVLMITAPNAGIIKLGIVLLILFGGLSWAIVRSLFVRLEAPEGIVLRPADAPALFQLIDKLRDQLRCSRFHIVLLSGDYNASVTQIPRLGIFGWQKNYLTLGLPLMQSLRPDEFEAVLAHEFAHLSGNHGRLGTWIYRLRRSWEGVFENLANQQSGGTWMLSKFVSWYWPRFNAHAFVLSRAQEYQADALAASLAGPSAIAGSLMRISIYGRHLDEAFWEPVVAEASREAAPPRDIYARMPRLLGSGPDPAKLSEWMRQSYLMDTTNFDTHPCLRDRLRAIGQLPEGVAEGRYPAELPPIGDRTAADVLLGARQDDLTATLSQRWADAVAEGWAEKHRAACVAREELAKLDAQPEPEEEASDDADAVGERVSRLWARANAIRETDGDTAALPLVTEVLRLRPADPLANFVIGCHLLQKEDATGIERLEIPARDPELARHALIALAEYYHRHGLREKRREIEDRLEALDEIEHQFHVERSDAKKTDTFLPHGLPESAIGRLRTIFSAEPAIADAVIARKETITHPEKLMYVIGITVQVPWWQLRTDGANQKLINRLVEAIELEGHFLIFVRHRELKPLGKAIAKVPDSLIYERTGSP
ncbi:MAG: M48 family metallopeptidase [Verrucomicrobiales bacterium]|nr:M48 family metallopeptidase [Verrucomicrobiales bacterium]